MNVSLFSPIGPGYSHNPKEKLGGLRFTTEFFNFGQTKYLVATIKNDPALYLEPIYSQKPSWFAIALRIAAIMTIIIPLLMLVGAWIYRNANRFELKERISELTPDTLNLIVNYVLLDSKTLSQVSKLFNSVFKENIDLCRNKLISVAVDNCIKVFELRPFEVITVRWTVRVNYDSQLAEFVHKFDKQQAVDILNRYLKKDFTPNWLATLAICDLQSALKIANRSSDIATVAISIARSDLEKANEIIESCERREDKQRALSHIAFETAKFDFGKGLEIAKTLDERHKIFALKGIIENLDPLNLPRAEEILQQIPDDDILDSLGLDNLKLKIKHYAKYDREKAIQLINSNLYISTKGRCHAYIAKEYVKVDPESALTWVNNLSPGRRFESMCEIVKASTNSVQAKELIEQMLELTEDNESKVVICAELMASFDRPRAIEIANLCQTEYAQGQALTGIIRAIKAVHLSEALQLAQLVLDIANKPLAGQDSSKRFNLFFDLAKALY